MKETTLITGFLGSGKTTFLRNYARRNLDRKIVYLVNEFSPRDIDAELLAEEVPNTVSIPGGSIFCKCLVSEFVSRLNQITEIYADAEALVIEASGIANPKAIFNMLSETGLNNYYRISRIISIVDPNSFLKLRFTLPNIVSQIEASDTVIVNKTDICDFAKIAETVEHIREINPVCEIIKAIRGEPVDIDLKHQSHRVFVNGAIAECKDANFATFSTVYPFSREEVELITKLFSDDIFRVKGWINGSYMDYSGGKWNEEKALTSHENVLVWIVKGDSAEKIKSHLFSRFNKLSFANC